jgi:hypothetical protein
MDGVVLTLGLVQRIVACGGSDLLAQALRVHAASDDIVIWSCRTLCNCILTLDAVNANDRSTCQDKLAQQHVPGILVNQFAERLGVMGKLAAQWALKAVGCLARRHEGNMHRFVELGVCELLQSVRQHFTLDDEKIAESVCWVIGNVSYPSEEAQARWGACGACDVVLTTLRKHVSSEETVQGGYCWFCALVNLPWLMLSSFRGLPANRGAAGSAEPLLRQRGQPGAAAGPADRWYHYVSDP